jgi:glycosyltransferase involved in cell wall biosynthesis
MRILYINNLNQVAEVYGEEMTRRGHSVRVYEPSLTGGSALLPLKLAMMPGRIFKMRDIAGNLKPSHFDLVHIHWASYGVLGLVSRIPFIVHCRGSDVRYRLKQPFFHAILKYILDRAAAVLCTTPDLIPIIQPVRPDVLFFPGSIDTERFAPGESEQSHPWTLLLFARLDAIKGCEIALQGIARFAGRHPQVRVQLLDWGPETEKYKRLYGGHFEFVPFVTQELVQRLICSADAVVGQVFLGAIGMSELQAMSCARPVITSFRYETAYPAQPPVCQATTAEEVDERLEDLFQHPEVATELGQRARTWVIDYHSRQVLGVKLEMLYQSILGEPGEGLTNELSNKLKLDRIEI